MKQLHLSINAIGDEGVGILAHAIVHCEQLDTFNVGNNGVTVVGWQSIFEMVQRCKQLQQIDVSLNVFSEAGTKCVHAAREKLHKYAL